MNRFNVVQDSLNNRGIQKRLRVLKKEAGLLCSKTLPSGEVWTISCCSVDWRKLLLLKRHYYKCGLVSGAKARENWKIRQFKIAFERSCVVSNFVSGALFPFGQYQEHGFWILRSSKAGRPLITDFQQVYSDPEIWLSTVTKIDLQCDCAWNSQNSFSSCWPKEMQTLGTRLCAWLGEKKCMSELNSNFEIAL